MKTITNLTGQVLHLENGITLDPDPVMVALDNCVKLARGMVRCYPFHERQLEACVRNGIALGCPVCGEWTCPGHPEISQQEYERKLLDYKSKKSKCVIQIDAALDRCIALAKDLIEGAGGWAFVPPIGILLEKMTLYSPHKIDHLYPGTNPVEPGTVVRDDEGNTVGKVVEAETRLNEETSILKIDLGKPGGDTTTFVITTHEEALPPKAEGVTKLVLEDEDA